MSFVLEPRESLRYGYHVELKANPIKSSPPWGTWEVLFEEEKCKVKRITVHPGHRLSYQKHSQRSEHWFIVQGTAKVTLNDVECEVVSGQSLDIPRKMPHRVQNIGKDTLVFVEIQTGDYFGEDDNTRLHDDYGRS